MIPETPQVIWEHLQKLPENSRLVLTFPFDADRFVEPDAANGPPIPNRCGAPCAVWVLTEFMWTAKRRAIDTWTPRGAHTHPEIVADRVVLTPERRQRILDSLEMAARFGNGRLSVHTDTDRFDFSATRHCARCDQSYAAPLPNLFSFNSPIGACDTCRGFGRVIDIDLDLIIPDPGRSLAGGAVKPWGAPRGR